MNAGEDAVQRRNAKLMLILCPVSFMAVFAAVTLGWDPGIRAGHPLEYLQATCFLWALISTVLPILRLARIFSLPNWFVAIVYFDMYLYVLSLCSGLYLNLSWWGDMTHVFSSFIVSGMVFMVLGLMDSRLPAHASFGGRKGFVAILFLVSLSFGGIWEIMEGMTDIISGHSYMVYGAVDTLGDLTADMIGVTILCKAVYIALGRTTISSITSGLRFGKHAFEIEERSLLLGCCPRPPQCQRAETSPISAIVPVPVASVQQLRRKMQYQE